MDNNNVAQEILVISRVFNWLTRNFENGLNENTQFIIRQLIKVFKVRIGITALLGFLDLIPFGFIFAGTINAIINTPFLYKIGEESKDFLVKKTRDSGGRQNIMNIIEGYRDSISLINNLRNKNDWSRKIQILNN